MNRSRWIPITLLALCALMWAPLAKAAFDLRHPAWDALLKQQVVVAPGGVASAVRYAALRADQKPLRGYLASVSAVTPQEYGGWSRNDRLAFLINAYNAFTIDLVLTRYPDLKSIKDLGSVFQSPWKRKFFTLLGERRSLDDVEHGLIRAPGAFDDPRIHVAVVCASMSVSKLFDWYHADFERGHQGLSSLQTLFIRHADALGTTPTSSAEIRAGRFKIVHLDYDWSLNDAR